MNDRIRLSNALLLSLMLHALVLALLPFLRQVRVSPPPALLDVDLVPLAPPPRMKESALPQAPIPEAEPAPEPPAPPPEVPLPRQQAVSPSDAGEEMPPPDTRFTSDRNNTVRDESIRRGEPQPAADVGARNGVKTAGSPSLAKNVGRPPEHVLGPHGGPGAVAPPAAAPPRLDDLLPSAPQLAREGYGQAPAAEAQAGAEGANAPATLLKYGDTWHATSHRAGALDFLPDVREGDVTLLNTKAELFSPFVRRVALRVFESLVIALRRDIGGVRQSAQETVTMEAVMNRRGDLVKLEIKNRSVTAALATDRNLQQACYDGFFDRNPPPGAEAADGNIHFLFSAQVAVLVDAEGRRGGRAVFSAGLL